MDSWKPGKKRSRVLLGAVLAAGLLVPLMPAVAQATPGSDTRTVRTIALPVPDGTTQSIVNGGDPTGRYLVGTSYAPATGRTGLLWRHGRMTRIDDSPLQPAQIDLEDVNRHGVVVGQRMTDLGRTDAFVYRAGRFTILPALNPGEDTEAVAVNSRGDVVGQTFSAGGWRVVVWPADRPGTVRVLTLPDGQPADALAGDIDEDGTVVGYLHPYPPGTPYIWPARGIPHPLPVPADSQGGNAVAIRLGMVAGNVYHPVDPTMSRTVPTLWNQRTGTRTMWTGLENGARAVNRWGTIGLYGAVQYADGRTVSLGYGAPVTVVTDRGIAAGATDLFNGQAVIWVGW